MPTNQSMNSSMKQFLDFDYVDGIYLPIRLILNSALKSTWSAKLPRKRSLN